MPSRPQEIAGRKGQTGWLARIPWIGLWLLREGDGIWHSFPCWPPWWTPCHRQKCSLTMNCQTMKSLRPPSLLFGRRHNHNHNHNHNNNSNSNNNSNNRLRDDQPKSNGFPNSALYVDCSCTVLKLGLSRVYWGSISFAIRGPLPVGITPYFMSHGQFVFSTAVLHSWNTSLQNFLGVFLLIRVTFKH